MSKILIIDDDSLVRHAYALTLEDLNYEVKAVSSGKEGLEELKKDSFDLVFLDLNMPGMNGVDTLRAIRGIDDKVPVYIVSGFHNAYLEGLNELKNDGIHFELAKKPLKRDQLKEIVENVLRSFSDPDRLENPFE